MMRLVLDLGHVGTQAARGPNEGGQQQHEQKDERHLEHPRNRKQRLASCGGNGRVVLLDRDDCDSSPPERNRNARDERLHGVTGVHSRHVGRAREDRAASHLIELGTVGGNRSDEPVIGRVGDPVTGTDQRDAQGTVDQDVAAHEPIQLLAPAASYRPRRIGGTDDALQERLRDEVTAIGRGTNGVSLVDLADDGKNERTCNRKPEGGDDGEAKY